MKILCPGCGSDQCTEDHLVIEDNSFPCWYCLDCQYIWRREEDDKEVRRLSIQGY